MWFRHLTRCLSGAGVVGISHEEKELRQSHAAEITSLGWLGNVLVPEELKEVAGEREVWAFLLTLLPLWPWTLVSGRKWMDGNPKVIIIHLTLLQAIGQNWNVPDFFFYNCTPSTVILKRLLAFSVMEQYGQSAGTATVACPHCQVVSGPL